MDIQKKKNGKYSKIFYKDVHFRLTLTSVNDGHKSKYIS